MSPKKGILISKKDKNIDRVAKSLEEYDVKKVLLSLYVLQQSQDKRMKFLIMCFFHILGKFFEKNEIVAITSR